MKKRLLRAIGIFAPGLRPLDDWISTYWKIISALPLSKKTLLNRSFCIDHLATALGHRPIGRIRPHEISTLVMSIRETRQFTARRVLIEARTVFSEAVNYGWIDRNPAAAVRIPAARIARNRLTLEQWAAIRDYAAKKQPAWVQHMIVLALVSGQRRGDLVKLRFCDVQDGHLHVIQQKTGQMLRLPLALRLDAAGISLGEAIDACRRYRPHSDEWMLRKSTGGRLVPESLSARFEEARNAALGEHSGAGTPPSLHECRSLAERLYRAQGIDTRTLLGHKRQSMTDQYNDDRGLTAGAWKTLVLQDPG